MDTEKSGEVLDVSEPRQQEETEMEKEVVSKLETPEEFTEPEKPPAADEEAEQLAVNGHDAEVINLKETEEPIVTENFAPPEEKIEMEIEDSKKSEMESEAGAVAPPEPDESSEKISDPDPENMQPEPENDPEPLPVQTPLAESAPEPEPEKLAESVPQAEEQTSPEPTVLQPPIDTQPPSQPEETVLQKDMDTRAEEAPKEEVAEKDVAVEPPKKVEEEKPADTVLVADVSSEKQTEAVTVKEEEASAGSVKPAEDEKEAEPVKPDTLKGAEAAAEAVKSATNAAEEDPAPASGSLSFALLERQQTKDALQTSRTLVVLRGLPGSGKSFLARAIADAYKEISSVVSADDHGVKPESPESSVEGYKAVDEAVVACCSAGTASSVLIVVDDTNHTRDRLARLGEVAEQHRLVAVFLEPRTEWSRDPAQLSKKTKRGLEEAQLAAMRGQLDDMSLPLYFGWFLLPSIQEKVQCASVDFLKTLSTLEAFKKHLIEVTGKAEKEDFALEQYFRATKTLHCTTKFCDYGKAEGAKEYAQNPAVKDFYGSTFELSLTALFMTPRTVGARVSLTEEQLLLWPADAEKEAGYASLPLGSRAHVTLGCAEGIEPVQTGLDLLQILALQQEGQQGEVIEVELGTMTYYGEGRWLLSLREPICSPACFSSFYDHKEPEPTKKEPKKKLKCTIL